VTGGRTGSGAETWAITGSGVISGRGVGFGVLMVNSSSAPSLNPLVLR